MDQELIDRYARTSELTRDGMARQAALGHLQGQVPLGYRNVRRSGEKTVELADAETIRLVGEAFDLKAKGLPLHKILMKVTERERSSRHGKPLGPSALWGILTNPFYCGLIRYKGSLVAGQYEPMITMEAFWGTLAKLKRTERMTC